MFVKLFMRLFVASLVLLFVQVHLVHDDWPKQRSHVRLRDQFMEGVELLQDGAEYSRMMQEGYTIDQIISLKLEDW